MTLKQLLKELNKIGRQHGYDMPIYTADHDHSECETNSLVGRIEIIDQYYARVGEKENLNRNPEFKITGPYIVIRP